jgi:hypothetical protein
MSTNSGILYGGHTGALPLTSTETQVVGLKKGMAGSTRTLIGKVPPPGRGMSISMGMIPIQGLPRTKTRTQPTKE